MPRGDGLSKTELAMCNVSLVSAGSYVRSAGLKLLRLIQVGQTTSPPLAFRVPECPFLGAI